MLATDAHLNVAPLTFSPTLPTRGEDAAALGYTGGGRLQLIPALISRPIDALGRDIYGNQIIARTVIEMKADVAPGDSGGPVVLPDGTVGGVTFSAVADGAAGRLRAVANGRRQRRIQGDRPHERGPYRRVPDRVLARPRRRP